MPDALHVQAQSPRDLGSRRLAAGSANGLCGATLACRVGRGSHVQARPSQPLRDPAQLIRPGLVPRHGRDVL